MIQIIGAWQGVTMDSLMCHLGPPMPYPSTPCGWATPEATLQLFHGWLAHRACDRLLPLWTPHAVCLSTNAMNS
jgi:hypothetical protein